MRDWWTFGHAARLAGYPAMTYGGRIMTRERWDAVTGRAGREERAGFMRRLQPHLLVATPEGRGNLRTWLDAGRPVPPANAVPLAVGDVEGLVLVLDALVLVPAPVRWYITSHVVINAVGFTSAAWTSSPMRDRPIEISLSDRADRFTVLHEFGHAWHRAPVAIAPPTSIQWAGAHVAVRDRFPALLEQHKDSERLADAMAESWLAGARRPNLSGLAEQEHGA
jgi:hypothetical protein